MQAEGMFPSNHGVWVWGGDQLAFPIPGSQCLLYTNYIYGRPFLSEPDGSVLIEHSWPNSMNGAYIRVQCIAWVVDNNNYVFRASNGVFAQCQ